ncbi:hypothetical protein C0J52_22667 [Blattella germanica]|nr:hypothetical protein C0J52_22667 [Blattella germanica]
MRIENQRQRTPAYPTANTHSLILKYSIIAFVGTTVMLSIDSGTQGTCCRSAVLSTIRNLRLASANAYEASMLAGSMLNLSSSTSPTNCGGFKSTPGSDAVESPLALGLRRYLARMSSVLCVGLESSDIPLLILKCETSPSPDVSNRHPYWLDFQLLRDVQLMANVDECDQQRHHSVLKCDWPECAPKAQYLQLVQVLDLVLRSEGVVVLVRLGRCEGQAMLEDLECERCSHLPDLQQPRLVSSLGCYHDGLDCWHYYPHILPYVYDTLSSMVLFSNKKINLRALDDGASSPPSGSPLPSTSTSERAVSSDLATLPLQWEEILSPSRQQRLFFPLPAKELTWSSNSNASLLLNLSKFLLAEV